MDLLRRFVEYLASQKNSASKATIKNYRADVKQFVIWFETEFAQIFIPNQITPQIIEVYKKLQFQEGKKLSPKSLERHLSSLRKFFHFLKIEGTVSKSPFETIKNSVKNNSKTQDKWYLSQFKNYLYIYNLSYLTIKNYIIDIRQFFNWLEQVMEMDAIWDVRKKNVFEKINSGLINEYKERLLDQNFSPKTINRKLSSLRKYLTWAKEQNLIKTAILTLEIQNEKLEGSISNESYRQGTYNKFTFQTRTIYSRFLPLRLLQKTSNAIMFMFDSLLIFPLAKTIDQIKYLAWKTKGRPVFRKISNESSKIGNYPKSLYAPLAISTRYFPLHRKILHRVRHNRPKWYKKYHSYSFVHYFHFAILVIFMSALGFALYNEFINIPYAKKEVLGLENYHSRILEFKGRLTDSLDNPITKPNTQIRIGIYDDPTAIGASLLWQEAIYVNPNKDGAFEAILGANTPLPKKLFLENPYLWIGISIGETAELTPRQELPTASYAVNAQTLRGLSPITSPDSGTKNVILALDSSGNLNIGGYAVPIFQATSGQFTLSGKVLFLTTLFGSNDNVVISPDGLGKIDLQKPLQNTSNNNNIASAIGAVEVDDLLAVLATSSGQSAFTINQDGTAPLISASTSGTAKFTVENDGTIISAKGANWQPTFDSNNALNIASSSGLPFVTFDTINRSVGIGTIIPEKSLDVIGSFRATSDITLSKFTSNGGIIYTNGSGMLAQASAGTSTQCLLGGNTPKFGTCVSYNNISESGGNIGIGTTLPLFKLDIQDSQSATAAAQIFNTNTGTDADGLIIKLGNTNTTTVATSNHFISFETSGIGIVGSIQGNGAGITYATSGVADFAEYFKKDESQAIEYGAVLCINDKGLAIPCDKDNTRIIGVASEHPAFLGGENLGDRSIAVGLVGQVSVRVSTLNGDIKPGDPLTYSSIPGVAVKATKPGQIVGRAIESFDPTEISGEIIQCPDNQKTASDEAVYVGSEPVRGSDLSSNITITQTKENVNTQINGSGPEGDRTPGTRLDRSVPNQSGPTPSSLCGKIIVSVNVSWYDPDVYLTNTGELSIVNQEENSSPIIQDSLGRAVERIGAFSKIIVADLTTGLIKAEEITTNSLSIATESITIAGVNLKDYILQTISETLNSQLSTLNSSRIVSPIAKIDEIRTNLISPLADNSNISISLHDSQFIIHNSNNATGSAVATIDSSGNASFSGTLSSQQLEVNEDATIGGTLRAKKILADSIEGLEPKVSTLAAQTIDTNITNYITYATYSGTLTNIENLSIPFATFTQGLMSFGPTSLAETSIAGNLYIQGSLILTSHSINVLGRDLELQPLRQGGLSFLAGLVKIDENGNLKVEGIAEFAKDVKIKGDLVASGSATFRKINLSLIEPALAVSQTEIIATGSAGVAAIKEYQTEITIKNNLVTDKSLIYITPVGTPSAQPPFLMRQTFGEPAPTQDASFTVGVQTASPQDTLFNWLIVN